MAPRAKKARTKGSYRVSVYIGTGSVAASLVLHPADGSSHVVIWNAHEVIPLKESISKADAQAGTEAAIRNVFKACGTKALKALKAYDRTGRVGAVRVTVAAPWAHTVARSVDLSHTRPFSITEELLHSLKERVSNDARRDLAESEIEGEVFVSCRLVRMLTNGYLALDPVGARAQELTLTFLIGTVAAWLFETVSDAHEREFAGAELAFATMIDSRARHAPEHNAPLTGYLVHVGCEATEIGVVEDGIVTRASYTPYGDRSVIRQLAVQRALPVRDAAALIASDERLAEAVSRKHLDEIFALYETNVIELLERLEGARPPAQVFLSFEVGKMPSFFERAIGNAVRAVHDLRPTIVIL